MMFSVIKVLHPRDLNKEVRPCHAEDFAEMVSRKDDAFTNPKIRSDASMEGRERKEHGKIRHLNRGSGLQQLSNMQRGPWKMSKPHTAMEMIQKLAHTARMTGS